MDTVLEQFDSLIRDGNGDAYRVYLHGRSRPRDTWQGWLAFVRDRDGRVFETAVETTQPDREAVRYWATGLTDSYLEGALARAVTPPREERTRPSAEPIIGRGVDTAARELRRTELERDVLATFRAARTRKLLADELFRAIPHPRADIIRALEHLEKEERLLVRRTEEGNFWVELTEGGTESVETPGVERRT